MLRYFIASLILSTSVQAAHLDTVCKSALETPPHFSEGFIARTNPEHRNVIETMDGKEIYSGPETIRSIQTKGDRIWALTPSRILELTTEGALVKDHNFSNARSLAMAGDLLVVIMADGGAAALQTKTGELAWTSSMSEVRGGEAVSAAFDGTYLQMAFAPIYEDGFTGIATIEASSGKVIRTSPYLVRRFGIVGPDAIAHWYNGQLVLNNNGWIHVITSQQLATGKVIKPRWVAYEVHNGSNPHYMMSQGDFFFQDGQVVGCGSYHEGEGHNWELKSALFKVAL